MKLRYERGALADLDEILAYVSADDREAAARLAADIARVASLIAAAPDIGVEMRRPPFRRFRAGRYLIVYRVSGNEVVIHYIRHDARHRSWEGEQPSAQS